jgi:hypothetical protein
MPVAKVVPAVGVAARNAVSSTPSVCTPSSRAALLSKTAVNAALTLFRLILVSLYGQVRVGCARQESNLRPSA